jgi:hypothetical protein
VSQGALHEGAELLNVRLVATRPFSVLGPGNLYEEHFFLVLGAVKGSAFDQGISLAILLDTATMAAVVGLQNGSLRAKNSVQFKRPSQI